MPELIYKKKEVRINASMISAFSDCECRFAFGSIIEGVPFFPKPIWLIFGGIISEFQKRLYQATPAKAKEKYKYGYLYLKSVLEGKGVEGEPPMEIRWLTERQKVGLSAAQIQGKINEKRQQYIGKGILALRALFLERIAPSPYKRVEVEFDISKFGLTIVNQHTSNEYPITGRVDKIGFLPSGEYDVFDHKTGEAQRENQRNKIVRDIQMTIYQFALEKIFRRLPRAMYIQPLNLSGAFLREHGEKALEKMRILVDIRKDPVHYENLINLASDISFVIDVITHPDKHDAKMLEEWQPISYWGRMAELKTNIEQMRFIPRVGETWCASCQYLDYCQKVNFEDWVRYKQSINHDDPKKDPVPAVIKKKKVEEPLLFGKVLRKQRPPGKSDRQIRKGMKDSGMFFKPSDIQAEVRRRHALIPLVDGHLCPCRRLGLVPTILLEHFQDIRKNKVAIKDVLSQCSYDDCPFRNDPA